MYGSKCFMEWVDTQPKNQKSFVINFSPSQKVIQKNETRGIYSQLN